MKNVTKLQIVFVLLGVIYSLYFKEVTNFSNIVTLSVIEAIYFTILDYNEYQTTKKKTESDRKITDSVGERN